MKKKIHILTAAVFAAAAVIPMWSGSKAFAEEFKLDKYTLNYTVQNGSAVITDCSGTGTDISIPAKINGLSVISIGNYAFSELIDLERVTIPDGVVSVSDSAFWNCSNLKNVTLGKGVAEIGTYAFSACPKLNSFTVKDGNNSYKAVSGMLYSKDGKSLISYAGGSKANIPNGTVSIGRTAFFGNTALESVSIPNGVTEIGDYAFSGCLALKKVTVPSTVKKIGLGSFMNCTELSQAVLGENISEIPDECFSVCTELSSVNISKNVKKIGVRGFFGCGKLSGIYIPKTVTQVGAEAIGIRYNIRHDKNEPYSDFYISGDKGSAMEKYARSAGVDFIDFNNILYGDVDRNGSVDALDASLVLTEYASVAVGNGSSFNKYKSAAGDFNKDGSIDALDASGILSQYAANAVR